MSELSKQVRADQIRIRSRVQSSVVSYEMFDPNVTALCDEHERLEAQLFEVNGALSGAIRRHDETKAELARVCNDYALLLQESGREGRELDRLEGLLRAWGLEFDIRRRDAVYAEAVRLAKEKP